jgi:Cu+-exporting ATPase
MTVDVATAMHTATHEGQTLYFCCAGCKSTFQDQPAKYAKAVRV